MLVSALMVMVVPLEAAPSMSVCMIGWPLTLVISKASSNRSFRPNWLWLAATRRARYSLASLVLRVLLGALGQVEHREVLAFLVLAGAVDDLVDVLERILVRREDDAEALQVGNLALVDLAVEQGQLVFQVVVVAADVAQGPGDVGDRRAARLGQRQGLVLAMRVGVDQQLQAALGVVFAIELGDAFRRTWAYSASICPSMRCSACQVSW